MYYYGNALSLNPLRQSRSHFYQIIDQLSEVSGGSEKLHLMKFTRNLHTSLKKSLVIFLCYADISLRRIRKVIDSRARTLLLCSMFIVIAQYSDMVRVEDICWYFH